MSFTGFLVSTSKKQISQLLDPLEILGKIH